jgi:hypothetical protein
MPVSLTTAQVIYAAETKLLELADIVAESSSFNRVKNQIKIGEALIRYIRVLNTDLSLTFVEEQAICQHMITIGDLYDFPASPTITSNQEFNFASNIILVGEQGPPGVDGGGTDFNNFSLTNNSVADSFALTLADAAYWRYKAKDGVNLRTGEVSAAWLSDGTVVFDHTTTTSIGNTSPIDFSVTFASGEIRLFATITSGSWDVNGTRYLTPNNGGASIVSTVLPNGRIFIGDASNAAISQTVSGDITLNSSGVSAITSGVIINADINASAAIAVNKLAALTASRAVISDSSGFLATSATTTTEVSYLSGVTSAIQTQLDSKIGSVTGAISTVVSSDLTINRAVISDPSGKIAVSGVTSTELGYVSGVTSAIQTQLNSKLNLSGGTMTGSILLSGGSSLNGGNGSAILLSETGGTAQLGGGIRTNSTGSGGPHGSYWKIAILEIGDWDMDTNDAVAVAHNISDFTKIRSISAVIRGDLNTVYTMFLGPNNVGSFSAATSTHINLSRLTGGDYDNASFNSTGFNRGWITILYEA